MIKLRCPKCGSEEYCVTKHEDLPRENTKDPELSIREFIIQYVCGGCRFKNITFTLKIPLDMWGWIRSVMMREADEVRSGF